MARKRGRAGRVSLLIPLTLMVLVLALGVRGMEESASEEGFGWIDPLALDLGELPPWADPRWSAEIDAVLASLPVFRTDDIVAQEAMERGLGELSFVKRAEITEILWPDGLSLDLVLRRPVACVPSEEHFLNVSADGVILSGRWLAPPSIGASYLPVIGPISDAWELFDLARPGDYLVEAEHVDALDVAISLDEHLDETTRAVLGRVVIDARGAREVTVEEPGTRLLLEGGRVILFGRAPMCGAPGELEAAAKWRAVAATLALDDPERASEPIAWTLADVRWDRPEIVPDDAFLARIEAEREAEREAQREAQRDAQQRAASPSTSSRGGSPTPSWRSAPPRAGRPRVR